MNKYAIALVGAAMATAMAAPVAASGQSAPLKRHAKDATAVRIAPDAKKAPLKRVTADGSDIYGYLCYSDNELEPYGLYTIDPKGYTLQWADPLLEQGAQIYTGWLRNGVLHTVALMVSGSGATSAYWVEQDLYTGDVFELKPVSTGSYFTVLTLNEKDGNIYGVASKPEGGWAFSSAPSGSPDIVRPICDADAAHTFISLTFNQEDGKMYGINQNLDFVTVSTDGTVEVLTPVSLDKPAADFQTGLIYSALEHKFYWNVNYADDTSALCTIDPSTYKFEVVETYDYLVEFAFFVSPDGKPDPALPTPPVYVGSDFGAGALSGTVTFRMPAATEGGTPIDGQMEWTAWLDNAEYSTGTAAPGSDVVLTFSDLTQGRHIFTIAASKDGKESLRGRQALFIGPDRPKTPADVTLAADGSLTWSAVTEGVDGGYIDIADLSYEITDGGQTLATVKGTEWTATLPADADMKAYRFGVSARYGADNVSEIGWSNYQVVGKPFPAPVSFVPTPSQALLFTMDELFQSRGWRYDDGYEFGTEEAFKCDFGAEANGITDLGAWLFLPAVNFTEGGKVYDLTLESRLLSALFPYADLRVFIGDHPEAGAMTEPLGDKWMPGASYETSHFYIVPAEAGVKYVGLYCSSKDGIGGLAVRDFKIALSEASLSTPLPPADIKAQGAAEGKLEIEVAFSMPSKDISGNALPADAQLKATVVNTTGGAREEVTGKPGEKMTVKVAALQGTNTLTLTAAMGEIVSQTATVEVYAGMGIPATPGRVTASTEESAYSTRISWPAVTSGVGEGYIDPAKITYTVYAQSYAIGSGGWKAVATDLKECEYVYTLPKGTDQSYVVLAVAAVNEAGESAQRSLVGFASGASYILPMSEDFGNMLSDDDFSLEPYIFAVPTPAYTAEWDVVRPEQISSQLASQEGYYLVAYGEPGAKARIGIPRFATYNSDPTIVDLRSMSCHGVAQFSVYAECYGVQPTLIGTVPLDARPSANSAKFTLPEQFLGKDWVQIYFDCTLSAEATVGCIRGFEIYSNSGVGEMEADTTVTVVDLAGRVLMRDAAPGRVSELEPGIYIINGRKTVVR